MDPSFPYDRLVRNLLEDEGSSVETPSGEKLLGKYRLLRQIGRGGMGVVYEAYDPNLQRSIALKVVKEERSDPNTILRLHREAAIAAQLRHPNIVGIHEVGVLRDGSGMLTHFIAMDLVQGRTLADLLEEGKTARSELLRILEEAARAAGYAHKKGVIHRDLKPANILIDQTGSVTLADFGLAHTESFRTQLTQSGAVMGTPHYMAPEQVEGRVRAIGPPTDSYALGVILYEILSGRLPFQDETPAKLYPRILNEDPPRPGRYAHGVERELDIICLKAMEKSPARRYSDAGAMAEDLRRAREGEPIAARPSSWFYRARKKVARRRGALVAVAVTTLLAGVAVAFVAVSYMREREYRSAKEEARIAFARGELGKALAAWERARRIKDDPETAERWRDCRERIRREEAHRRLEAETIHPLAALIRETRPYFYVRKIDLRKRLRKVEAALENLERISRDPLYATHFELWKALGTGWSFVGDTRRAEAALLKAVGLAPRDWEVNFQLAASYFDRCMGALAERTKHLREESLRRARVWSREGQRFLEVAARRGASEDPLLPYLVEAYRAWWKGDLAGMEKHSQGGLRELGDHLGTEALWLMLGIVRLQNKKPEQALPAVNRAIERGPQFSWAYYHRGLIREQLGKREEAAADYATAVRINPYLLSAHLNLGTYRQERGDLDAAIRSFTEAIERAPDFPLAYYNRGNARLQKGDRKGALADFGEAIRLRPGYSLAYNNRGAVRRAMGDLRGASSDFSKAIERDPLEGAAYVNRAQVRADLGDGRGAMEDIQVALRINPKDVRALTTRGTLRLDFGDVTGAIGDHSRAIEIAPRFADAYVNRACAFHEKGDLAQAIRDCTEAIKLDPRMSMAYYNRARARYDLGRQAETTRAKKEWAAALLDLKEALRWKPPFASAHFLRGNILQLLGDDEGALREWTETVRLDPKHAKAYMNRAVVRRAKKDLKGALVDLNQATRLQPGFLEAYLNRGLLELDLKNYAAAAKDFMVARRLAPPGWRHRSYVDHLLGHAARKEWPCSGRD